MSAAGEKAVAPDIQEALDRLPNATADTVGKDGIPTFVSGDLGHVELAPDAPSRQALEPALEKIAPVFRLTPENLDIRTIKTDPMNITHVRYRQTKNHLDVINGDLLLHVDQHGQVIAANGTARQR